MKTVIAVLALMLFVNSTFAQKDSSVTEKNKKIVSTYVQELLGNKDATAVDRYVSDDFKQHDPTVADGKKALKDMFTSMFKNATKSKFQYDRIAADGDLVFIQFRTYGSDGKPAVMVEVFRLKDGKIVEHWDVMQSIPDKSLNGNTMY